LGREFVRREPVHGFEAADMTSEMLTIIAAPPFVDRREAHYHVDLSDAVEELESAGRTVFVCSYFDLVHRPWWVVARGIASLG
jgi:hypothetical protein